MPANFAGLEKKSDSSSMPISRAIVPTVKYNFLAMEMFLKRCASLKLLIGEHASPM